MLGAVDASPVDGATLGTADVPVLGAVDAPAPEQAASAIEASMTSAPRRVGVVITRWSSS
jgi:hypothetical protein